MKLYTKNNIRYCKERVFGKVNYYKHYRIKHYYSDNDANLIETDDYNINNLQIRIVGTERIKKDKLYMSINEYDLFQKVKSIGSNLFNLFDSEIEELVINHGNYFQINTTIVNTKTVLKNEKEIMEIIAPFLKEYGMPIDYLSISNSLDEENNSIDLNTLCTFFLILHIISDLAGHYNKGCKIEHLYKILGISSKIEGYELVAKLLNLDFFYHSHLEKFQIEYIEYYPINCTHNLFSFAYERLKMNMIGKANNYKTITRINNKGIPITIDNIKGKNARSIERKVPTDPVELKIYNAKKQRDAYDNLVKEFKKIKKYAAFIEKYDYDDEYTVIINTANNIKYVSHYKRKKYPNLYNQIATAYIKIQKKLHNKNDRI